MGHHHQSRREAAASVPTLSRVLDSGKVRTMSEENYKSVFSILINYRSLPFLKLCSLTELDEIQVRQIVSELEARNMVRVTDKGDPFKEIVTVREAAFAAGRGPGD